MSKPEDLIEVLRCIGSAICNEAADALEAQAREIEGLRKQDDALILQLVEALECHCEMTRSLVRSELAVTAGRARLAPPPPTA